MFRTIRVARNFASVIRTLSCHARFRFDLNSSRRALRVGAIGMVATGRCDWRLSLRPDPCTSDVKLGPPFTPGGTRLANGIIGTLNDMLCVGGGTWRPCFEGFFCRRCWRFPFEKLCRCCSCKSYCFKKICQSARMYLRRQANSTNLTVWLVICWSTLR